VILSEAELVAAVTRDRAAGKRVGFIRLSFDLLRAPVVRLLEDTAATSDRLVVAVIDDGGAPLISVADRAELVDSLRAVDYVVICANDQVDRLAAVLA